MTDFRRHDDDPLYERLLRLETQVTALERKTDTLSMEQKHMYDLFSARFSTIERSQDLALSELRGLVSKIDVMAAEADKSPAGRSILAKLSEFNDGARERQDGISELNEFKQKVEGALGLLNFVGWSGLCTGAVALIWVALRAMGKVP